MRVKPKQYRPRFTPVDSAGNVCRRDRGTGWVLANPPKHRGGCSEKAPVLFAVTPPSDPPPPGSKLANPGHETDDRDQHVTVVHTKSPAASKAT